MTMNTTCPPYPTTYRYITYIYMYIYTHTCIYIYVVIYTCTYIYTYVCMHVCIYLYTYPFSTYIRFTSLLYMNILAKVYKKTQCAPTRWAPRAIASCMADASPEPDLLSRRVSMHNGSFRGTLLVPLNKRVPLRGSSIGSRGLNTWSRISIRFLNVFYNQDLRVYAWIIALDLGENSYFEYNSDPAEFGCYVPLASRPAFSDSLHAGLLINP